MATATEVPERSSNVGAIAKRVLTAGIPLWLVLVLVIAGLVTFAVVALGSDDTDLGPAVSQAESVEAEVTMCNEVVDRDGINPRDAELRAQDAILELGADDAEVRVERRDCGAP